jgi:hypothetical protein
MRHLRLNISIVDAYFLLLLLRLRPSGWRIKSGTGGDANNGNNLFLPSFAPACHWKWMLLERENRWLRVSRYLRMQAYSTDK